MKKKLLLVLSIVALLVCLFAISVSAENALKPQDNNGYGELSFFDESITVGRTDNQNGFSPYIDAEGTTYARVVIGDGTTFYTFPTAYVYSSTRIHGSNGKTLWSYDLTSLNSAMETATETNPGWTISNIYRIELPYNTIYLNSDGTQKFYGFSNVIEIYLQPNSTTIDTGSNVNCLFHSCEKLTTIHNIDSFLFKHQNNISGTFQNCKSLTSLTLGVSPDVKKIGSSMFNTCTNLERVNLVEAFPNATEMAASVFINCTNLKSISSNQKTDGVIELKYTYYENSVFQNCESIRAIKFTASSVKLLQNVFHSLDSLEFISFPRDSKLELPSCEVFSNNKSLKAIALPDNCTTLPDRGFKNCANLKAVYLPANLATMVTNGWDQSPFTSDPELYFVNEWFDVLDNNGDFLLDSFVMPERPDVYYFPSTLTNLCDQKTSGTGFYNCYRINPVLVFDTGVTQFIPGDGLLINCGTKGEVKTIVFLGDMTKVCHSSQDSRLQNIQYVFANANDKSPSDVEIVNNNTKNPGETAKAYFCAAGTSYQLVAKDVAFGESMAGSHFHNPKADKVEQATCITPELTNTYCFCKEVITSEETAPALGHEAGEFIQKYYEALSDGALNYFKDMITEHDCVRCEEVIMGTEEDTALFTADGYSIPEVGTSDCISHTIKVNKKAIEAYELETGNKVNYGVVAAVKTSVDSPLSYNGETLTAGTYALAGDMTGTEYTKLIIKVSGVQESTDISCNAYVAINKEITYLCGDVASKTALKKQIPAA